MKEFLRNYQIAAMANCHIREDADVLSHLALGLTGESGEVADIIKKSQYNSRSPHVGVLHLMEELGDVMFYAACLAGTYGFGIEEVLMMNAEKLSERYPEGPFSQLELPLQEVGR